MGKGLPRSMKSAAPLKDEIIKQAIFVNGEVGTLDGATGVGDMQMVIGDFPEGNILLLGAVGYFQFAGDGATATLVDAWAGDYAVGTTPDAGDNLTGTDANIIPSTALAAATAEVSPNTRGANGTPAMLDNTDGSLEINLNLLVDDVNISGDGISITVTGVLHLAYIMLGDD